MAVFILRRLFQAAIVVWTMATIVFIAVYAVGDPVAILANPEADQVELDAIRQRLGLDKPLVEQYVIFLSNAVRGDLGNSFVYNEPALSVIVQRMTATVELAVIALLLALLIGLPLGIYAGVRHKSLGSRTIMAGSVLGFSLPNFWQGLILILMFSIYLGWLPPGGRGKVVDVFGLELSFLTWDGLTYLILPAINLSLFKIALVIRLARAGTREAMTQDYIRFARAKGIPNRRIIGVHVLKNIMIPIVTIVGIELGSMIAFAVVTESVFSYPGMGKLLIDSIVRLDRPVVVAYLMVIVVTFVSINLVVDLIYAMLDPRVRLSGMR